MLLLATPVEAHCFSIWHYKTPQKCVSASHRYVSALVRLPPERTMIREERIEIALPKVEWVECPVGDERLKGIAKLRDLDKDHAPQ